VPRFHLTLQDVTQMHADIGWFLGALMIALVIGMRYGGAPARVVRLGWIVLAGLAVEGTLGYIQYVAHLPAGLVWVHVATSVLLWILVLRLLLATRERLPMRPSTADPGAQRDQAALSPASRAAANSQKAS
jgi:cytochrome c oxidase assembly protein subunit 15